MSGPARGDKRMIGFVRSHDPAPVPALVIRLFDYPYVRWRTPIGVWHRVFDYAAIEKTWCNQEIHNAWLVEFTDEPDAPVCKRCIRKIERWTQALAERTSHEQ